DARTAELETAVAGRKAAEAADEQARQQAILMDRLTRALAELAGHEETRAEHEARAARLTRARQAEPVRPLLAELADRLAATAEHRARAEAQHADDEVAAADPGDPEDLTGAPGIPGPRAVTEAEARARIAVLPGGNEENSGRPGEPAGLRPVTGQAR